MNTNTELKLCPFCGGKHESVQYADIIGYNEEGYPINGKFKNAVNIAKSHGNSGWVLVEEWNIRPIEDALESENLHLKQEMLEMMEFHKKEIQAQAKMLRNFRDANAKLSEAIVNLFVYIEEHGKLLLHHRHYGDMVANIHILMKENKCL